MTAVGGGGVPALHEGAAASGPVLGAARADGSAASLSSQSAPPASALSAGEREILRVACRSQQIDSVGARILVSVGAEIIDGRLKPGDDLNSVDLARRFTSSRTPVREALQTLEREGLVEIAARKRPRVRHLGIEEVREIYELREHLYGLVSRRIVAHRTDAGLAELTRLQEALEAAATAQDLERYFWLVVEFRNAEARLAGNETVRAVLDSVGIRTLRLRHLSLSQPGRLETSADDHRRLLRAYADAEADLAAAITQSIVRRGLAAVERSGWTGTDPAD